MALEVFKILMNKIQIEIDEYSILIYMKETFRTKEADLEVINMQQGLICIMLLLESNKLKVMKMLKG